MAASSLAHAYAYGAASSFSDHERRKRLFLATSLDAPAKEFFRGRSVAPKRLADSLLAVSDVVRSRFHIPSAMLEKVLLLADPVITSSGDRLRFEGFSACCGAYARLDVLEPALDGDFLGKGTANVDFNAPMRASLAKAREGDDVSLALGAGGFEVRRNDTAVNERKVDLPARWVRGFTEVQAYQAKMSPRATVDGAVLRAFLRDLPASWKGMAYVSLRGNALRVDARPVASAIAAGGIARLRVLSGVAAHALAATIYAADDGGTTAWEVLTPDSRFTLVLSPDVWRGFSGEGQTLETLAGTPRQTPLGTVRSALAWQNVIDASALAADAGVPVAAIDAALAECAASGLVGYDLHEGGYFHRVLPFDASAVRGSQPRLRNAEKLVAEDAVEFEPGDGAVRAWVRSGSIEYRVTFEGDTARCTCPWYAKHRDDRGLCKHVLAAKLQLTKS